MGTDDPTEPGAAYDSESATWRPFSRYSNSTGALRTNFKSDLTRRISFTTFEPAEVETDYTTHPSKNSALPRISVADYEKIFAQNRNLRAENAELRMDRIATRDEIARLKDDVHDLIHDVSILLVYVEEKLTQTP